MIINTEQIKDLILHSDQSIYSIAKETGISRGALNYYRIGKADINNMTIETAKKIQEYINKGQS